VTRYKLPVFVNTYPDGRASLTCAHCAVDAGLEGAVATALLADRQPDHGAITWEAALTPEQVIAAAADQCLHLAAFRDRR
jgi:hypothetical protein